VLFRTSANTWQSIASTQRDCRLRPRWERHSSGILRNVDWHLFTDVSGQPIFLNCLTLEDETDGCPETSAYNYQSTLRNNPEGKELTSIPFFDYRGISICASYLLNYQIPNKLELADLYIIRCLQKSPAAQTPRITTRISNKSNETNGIYYYFMW